MRLGAKYPSVYKGISAHSAITCMDDFTHFVDYPIETYCCENEYETDLMYWLSKSKKNCLLCVWTAVIKTYSTKVTKY